MKNSKHLVSKILEKLERYQPKIEEQLTGTVNSVADGVAKVSGLYGVSYLEMVEFPHGIQGVAINLEQKEVGVIIL